MSGGKNMHKIKKLRAKIKGFRITSPGMAVLAMCCLRLTAAVSAAEASPGDGTAVPETARSPLPLAAALLKSPALVGSINIVNGSIFDPDDPREDKALYRLVNRLHATTRPQVIQQQLLFETGQAVSFRELEESERILRSNRYIQDARIEPVANDHGGIDVNVHTSDVWTLIPKISLSRTGGENESGIGLKEMNLLGTGVELEALYKSTIDRDLMTLKYADRQLGKSWYGLRALYGNNSDGHTYAFDIGKPFYSLASADANGLSLLDNDEIGSLYDRGEPVAEFRSQARTYELFKGWSAGLRDGWVKRITAGIAYDEHRFTDTADTDTPLALVPADRKLVYPFVGLEFVQDRFEKAENHDQINRVEDRFLGTRAGIRVGAAGRGLGSDRNALIFNAAAQTGFGASGTASLIVSSELNTRVEDDGLQDLELNIAARYYRRQSDSRLFYASLSGTYSYNLDLDSQLLLGGDNGLRGYPLRYQTGDKLALLTLEQRFFTDWYPFRLFRVGGAVFFDAGRAWGDSPVSDKENELLADIGFGLRIGNTRSGQGRMTHIDLAFPLNGGNDIKDVQFLIETKKSF